MFNLNLKLEENRNIIPESQNVEMVASRFNRGLINTELLCQRSYVWTDKQQQGLVDTLLKNGGIPEIHAVKRGGRLYIMDGKQRLTTIIAFLKDEFPIKRSYMVGEIKNKMQEYRKSEIFYSELDEETRNVINDTIIRFAIYPDMTDEEISIAFSKINTTIPLNDFERGIQSNLYVRMYCTSLLLEDYQYSFDICFTDAEKRKSNPEASLVRLMHLLKKNPLCENQTCLNMDNSYIGAVVSEFGADKSDIEYFRIRVSSILKDFFALVNEETFSSVNVSFYPYIWYIFSTLEVEDERVAFAKFVKEFVVTTPRFDNGNLTSGATQRRLEFFTKEFDKFKKI